MVCTFTAGVLSLGVPSAPVTQTSHLKGCPFGSKPFGRRGALCYASFKGILLVGIDRLLHRDGTEVLVMVDTGREQNCAEWEVKNIPSNLRDFSKTQQ